jgi:arginase
MDKRVAIVGAPTSAGAFAVGQERAPAAIRAAGFVDMLFKAGLDVADYGDVAAWRWKPDRENPRAQNVPGVLESAVAVAALVSAALADKRVVVVLGGDCTVELGTVVGHSDYVGRIGLLYFDMHADLNVPESVMPGALDWMGLAHILGRPGTVDVLRRIGPDEPLLRPSQILLFAHRSDQATPWEWNEINRLSLPVISLEEVAQDPSAAAVRALQVMESCDRLLVHFDVDVIDFTDAPLSENTGRNIGLRMETALSALGSLLKSPRLSALTIAELNPQHSESTDSVLTVFVEGLANSVIGHFDWNPKNEHSNEGTKPKPAAS